MHTHPRSKLASAHGRAALFMGDTGLDGAKARMWRRAWGAAVVLLAEGREAAVRRLARSKAMDAAVDESMRRAEMAAHGARCEVAAIQHALGEVA